MKLLLMTAALLFSAASYAYTTVENRSLDASGIRTLTIRTYSGPLTITGTDGDDIIVEAVIEFRDEWEDEEAREALEEGLVLELDKKGSQAELNSWVGDYDVDDVSFFTWGLIDLFRSGKPRPFSHLEVRVPRGIDIEINDYQGEVIISQLTGDVELITGGGPVEITDLTGDLDLQDGGGDIEVDRVSGDVEIRDGGGNVEVARVEGRLTIHDGGGNIEVDTIGGLLDIRDGGGNIRAEDLRSDVEIYDGGGEIDIRRVSGSVFLTDGGGGINVSDVEKDIVVYSRGGGAFNVRNVKGEVFDNSSGRRNPRNGFRDRGRGAGIDVFNDEDND